MPDTPCEITVPNLGEGVRYVVVKNLLINNGDWVDEDGGLIEVETDKSVIEIPSPVSGYIGDIQCKPGDVLPVGSRLLVVESRACTKASPHLMKKTTQMRKGDALKSSAVPAGNKKETRLQSLRQMTLASRMQHSANIVVPATIERQIVWDHIDVIKKYFRSNGNSLIPSSLEIICWAVVLSMHKFEKFKSKIEVDGILSLSDNAVIGVAVAEDGDDLSHNVASFEIGVNLADVSQSLRRGKEGGYHSVSISDMSSFGITRAVPVVVHPSVATIFIGAPQEIWQRRGWIRTSCLAISFDHRVMNGAYVASFLADVESNIKKLRVSFVG